MVDALLTAVKDHVLSQNPSTFVNGYANARLYQDGTVLTYENGEGTYRGLSDTEFNFFYLRYTDVPMTLDTAENPKTACSEKQGLVDVRLVAWVNNGDINKLVEVLLNDVLEVDFSTIPSADKQRFIGKVKIVEPITFLQQPEEVYKQETLKEDPEVMLAKNVTLVAMDFGLLFNYAPYSGRASDCLDRNICNDVCS